MPMYAKHVHMVKGEACSMHRQPRKQQKILVYKHGKQPHRGRIQEDINNTEMDFRETASPE
jgi:hypothetical protein